MPQLTQTGTLIGTAGYLAPEQAWGETVTAAADAMIDRHYGHLARDSREHAVALLDALALERAVDAAWTSNRRRAVVLSNSDSKSYQRRNRRRVDARWTPKLVLVATSGNENS